MKAIHKYIDQTILKPDATEQDIKDFIKGVNRYKFYATVVNPCWIDFLRKHLEQDIKLCSVVGFPLGASSTKSKAFAAKDLVARGCDEIDMVMNIGKFKSRDYKCVGREIEAVVQAAEGRVIKVIIETCLLSDEEKKAAAQIIMEKGAHFVKTSTGFSTQGADIEDVRLLRQTVGKNFGVKASGGIRTLDFTVDLIKAGANRIGTSAGIQIVKSTQIT